MEEEKGNLWIEELKKCIKQKVKVFDGKGQEFEGECRAINYQYGNIVLMTDTHKLIIRNVDRIERLRTSKTTIERFIYYLYYYYL